MIIPDFRDFQNSNTYYLSHGGPGSGRYPLGSGERPYQRNEKRLNKFKRKEEKLINKFDKFDVKISKKQNIANKKYQKAVKKSTGFFSSKESANKAFKKATAAQRKVNRITYKGSQYYKSYEKLAKKLDVPMDEKLKKRGLAYLDDVITNSKTAYQVALSRTI